jgi:hypothetical protein
MSALILFCIVATPLPEVSFVLKARRKFNNKNKNNTRRHGLIPICFAKAEDVLRKRKDRYFTNKVVSTISTLIKTITEYCNLCQGLVVKDG